MKIGIRAHDVVMKDSVDELIKRLKELQIDNIQLVFKKSFVDMPFNKDNAIYVSNKLKENNINVSMLGAYFNPVHSNKELVLNNKEYFIEHLKYANLMNAKYVGTETGSYNDDKWTYNPLNQTDYGYNDTMKIFHELKEFAEEYNTTILMEPAYGHVIYSVDRLIQAINELNSENVKVTIDLFNLLYIGNYKDYKSIFTYALKTFKDDIKIIHLKDFYVENDKLVQVGLGNGIIDFKFIIDEVKKYASSATLIFEGVTGDDIKKSLSLIKNLVD